MAKTKEQIIIRRAEIKRNALLRENAALRGVMDDQPPEVVSKVIKEEVRAVIEGQPRDWALLVLGLINLALLSAITWKLFR